MRRFLRFSTIVFAASAGAFIFEVVKQAKKKADG